MARLTDSAREAVTNARRAQTLPSWWMALGGLLLVAVAAFLLFQILRPAPAEPFAVPTAAPLPPPPTAAPVNPATDDTTVPVIETVRVPTNTGAVDVDRRAVDVAVEAVRALYTGDFSKVTFASGSTPPEPIASLRNVTVPVPYFATTVSGSGDALFYFKVDPDGPGRDPETTVTVRITIDPEVGFAYKPE